MVQRFKPISDDCHITSEFATGHPGVDFGRDGGSGDQPVFAAQAGLVTHAGAAQGFGGPAPAGWIVIDHPTAAGSGTTVYGSIIAEVAEGEWVRAGQRIARINPDPNTNGGTAPHLHFQVHPFVWQPGSQIDPVAWLDDAPAPTSAQSNLPICYGVDLSNHQPDINLKTIAEEGFEFAILKATEGTWLDPCFQQHYSAAREAGLRTAAYAYVRSETSPQEHADALDNVVRAAAGDMSVPICLAPARTLTIGGPSTTSSPVGATGSSSPTCPAGIGSRPAAPTLPTPACRPCGPPTMSNPSKDTPPPFTNGPAPAGGVATADCLLTCGSFPPRPRLPAMLLMSTPTWGIPATCSGEGVGRCGAVGLVPGTAGLDRLGWCRNERGHRRRAPGVTPAPPQQRLRLHHLDAGPRVFRLDQLIHPLRAARVQPKHRPIRNMRRAHRLLLIQP